MANHVFKNNPGDTLTLWQESYSDYDGTRYDLEYQARWTTKRLIVTDTRFSSYRVRTYRVYRADAMDSLANEGSVRVSGLREVLYLEPFDVRNADQIAAQEQLEKAEQAKIDAITPYEWRCLEGYFLKFPQLRKLPLDALEILKATDQMEAFVERSIDDPWEASF